MSDDNTFTVASSGVAVSCNITVEIDGRTMRLEPRDDITAIESARLAIWLMSHAVATRYGIYRSNIDYLKEHGLLRHFVDAFEGARYGGTSNKWST